MKNILYILVCFSSIFIFDSCKKKKTDPPASTTTPTPTPTPASTTYIGMLSAFRMTVQDLTSGGGGNSYEESASATYIMGGAPKDAGTISCNDTILVNPGMGLYGSQNPSMMMGFSTNPASVKWAVSGNAANSIPAFNYVDVLGFPTQFTLTGLPATIYTNVALSANFSTTITNCDSLHYWLNGVDDATGIKTLKSNLSSISFTAAEMTFAGGGGSGVITVQAYKNVIVSQGGKNVLVQNVTQLQTLVDLQ